MPYIPPSYRQITIAIPSQSLSVALFGTLEDRPWTRAQVGTYASAGKTPNGSTRVNRSPHLPYYTWTGTLATRRPVLAQLERMDTLIQQNPTVQAVLTDEYDWVEATKATWHNRTVITDSTFSDGGVSLCYCRFNVLLQGLTWAYFGCGGFEVTLSAEELI